MASKKKYYVVWNGHTPGIYDNWQDCLLQVKGYPDARYKSYPSYQEAKKAYASGPANYEKKQKKTKRSTPISPDRLPPEFQKALSVDAACSGNPGKMEYRGVWVRNGEEIFRMGPYERGTNNIGEFLAIVHAAALFQKEDRPDIPICTDSRTAMAWIRKKRANTKLKFDNRNQRLARLIQRAENWLKAHDIPNPILKWNTREWGEIPADFGRK